MILLRSWRMESNSFVKPFSVSLSGIVKSRTKGALSLAYEIVIFDSKNEETSA